jgi:hypothetical protein
LWISSVTDRCSRAAGKSQCELLIQMSSRVQTILGLAVRKTAVASNGGMRCIEEHVLERIRSSLRPMPIVAIPCGGIVGLVSILWSLKV